MGDDEQHEDMVDEYWITDSTPASAEELARWAHLPSVTEDDGGNLSPEEERLAAQMRDGGPEDSSTWEGA